MEGLLNISIFLGTRLEEGHPVRVCCLFALVIANLRNETDTSLSAQSDLLPTSTLITF